ncbi:serine/threonine-protein kinase [Nocardiopsis dassonvillei]|uniref:serine/threonine-protein kinase n=1 Tax=Nocardiopsis dassonvillei TaxID=2014 RepID=UPI000B9D5B5A|nr:serine/threonine-protein kinase [Nocardiopsis dassonvillei]ASU60735.1 serine/threonine protein kinase [Nocardiopsis dassonvillei]
MTKCTVPGCPGRVEDGFCGVCGMAPADVRPPDGPAPRKLPVPPTSGPQPSLGADSSANPLSGDPVHSHPLSGNVRLSGRSGPGSVSATSGASVSGAGRGSRRSSRGMLGMGMVQVPLVPYRDPSEAVMDNPVVAEKNRFCGNCGERVGRTQGEQPGRTEGFCRKCGTQFSFTPKLSPGDLVGGQYEVLGCLAHGGLGWIYLARDRNVNDRWVVLKGLLNAGDAEAHKAAAAERAFLSEVEHPNIVKIINFSQHPDPRTGIPGGHIVMEYVGGKSLRELLIERREDDPDAVLPPDQVIAYGLEVLRALGYLHSRGLLYCDFKPDNVIQSEEQIKLIDLGGVRRMDDTVSPVYTTPGYRVPEEELRGPGPTVSADLYSVGRALAVLSFRFSFMRDHPHSIPPRETVPLLQRHPSFDRLLRRATHSEPELRFHDAGDMADQLTGVLREVLSDLEGTPHPAPSTLFGAENPAARPDPGAHNADRMLLAPPPTDAAALLPAPLIDQSDPAAQHLRGFQTLPPEELVPALRAMPSPTPETLLMLVRALVTVGRQGEAMDVLQRFSEVVPGDWRTMWYLAVAELSTGRFRDARDHFDELYDHLPGELAPKLALALACERTGEHETAARLFRAVWNTDRSFVSAAFGLARIRLVQGDRAAATAVLDTVPELSRLHVHAQTALIAVLAAHHQGTEAADFVQAGRRLERIGLDGESADRLAVRVLESALGWLGAGAGAPAGEGLLGAPFTENGVRANLERRYRALAQRAVAPSERYELVDRANSLRPVTLL